MIWNQFLEVPINNTGRYKYAEELLSRKCLKKNIDIQPDTSFRGIILCRWGTSVSDEA